jgi:hypothetical protein
VKHLLTANPSLAPDRYSIERGRLRGIKWVKRPDGTWQKYRRLNLSRFVVDIPPYMKVKLQEENTVEK